MNKFFLFTFLVFTLLNLSCNDNYDFSNPLDSQAALQAPTNLKVVSMTTTQVSLSWDDPNKDSDYPNAYTGFTIEQSTNGTTFVVVKTLSSNASSTTITGTYDSTTTYYFRVQAKTAINKSGYSNMVNSRISFPGMVFVQGGTFQMGSNDANDYGASPPHSVTVGSFNIDKYEITYEKWTDVYNWGLTHGYTDLPAGQNGYSPNGTNNPVTSVNRCDILKWCNARSEKDGLTPVYYTSSTLATIYRTGQLDLAPDAMKWTANGYRLPTEAEWEFSARGGNNSQGYTYSGSNTIDNVAWCSNNSGNTTHTVGTKTANELGIYDMSGNVWEWCWDWYGTYSSSTQTDPKGATSGSYSVLRGGSFNYYDGVCRVACRYTFDPYSRYDSGGFRCTRD